MNRDTNNLSPDQKGALRALEMAQGYFSSMLRAPDKALVKSFAALDREFTSRIDTFWREVAGEKIHTDKPEASAVAGTRL